MLTDVSGKDNAVRESMLEDDSNPFGILFVGFLATDRRVSDSLGRFRRSTPEL